MKKLYLFICFIFIFLIGSVAGASSVSVKVSSNSVTKGSSVTVTATINADSGIYTTEGTLYCSGAGVDKSANMSFEDLNTANTSKSFSFTIKPTSAGTVTCSTSNVMIRELKAESRYSLNNATASITVKNPVVVNKPVKEYSSNNNLKSLEVEGYILSPEFSKDNLEYSIEVPNGTESVVISGTKEDSAATISGLGEINVNEGINKLEVKVEAENGNTKVYVINVTVKELDPIYVKINNKDYSIIRKEGILEVPENYEKSSVNINDEEVLCYKNIVTKNIIVGLKDDDGNNKFYSYDENKKSFTLYSGYKIGGINLNILSMPGSELPEGYSKVFFTYNDNKLDGYQYIDDNVTYAADNSVNGSDFYLLYGVNELSGEKGIYVYDKLEGTVQRFNNSLILSYQNKADNFFLYFLISVVFLAITIITLMLVLIKKKKNKSKFA